MGTEIIIVQGLFFEKWLKQVINVLEYASFDLPLFSGNRS